MLSYRFLKTLLSNNIDNIRKIKGMTNVFDNIGYYDIVKHGGKLPFDKKVDIFLNAT